MTPELARVQWRAASVAAAGVAAAIVRAVSAAVAETDNAGRGAGSVVQRVRGRRQDRQLQCLARLCAALQGEEEDRVRGSFTVSLRCLCAIPGRKVDLS